MKQKEMIKFRDILWALSALKRNVEDFNKMSADVKIDAYCGSCMLVEGIDKIADYFGYEVEDGFLKHLKLFDVDVMERNDETV